VLVTVEVYEELDSNVKLDIVSETAEMFVRWMYSFPPTYKLPPMPTPPVTVNAPVALDVAAVVVVIDTALFVVAPRPVTDCNVLGLLIVIEPVVADRVISVPLIKFVTPALVIVILPVDVVTLIPVPAKIELTP
jgi:hypothetical protein